MVSNDEIEYLINYLIDIKVNLKEGLLKDIDTVLNYLKEKLLTDTVEFDIDDDAGDELHSKFKQGDAVRIKDANWIVKNCHKDSRMINNEKLPVYAFEDKTPTISELQFLMAGKTATIIDISDDFVPFNKFQYKYKLKFEEDAFTKIFENLYFPEWVLDGVESNGE